jgi:putative colanic acid biosynthesis acetyltransferase WcaF
VARLVWNISYLILFRPLARTYSKNGGISPKMFWGKIDWSSHIYASVKYGLWNLEIGNNSSLGPKVDCYTIKNKYWI